MNDVNDMLIEIKSELTEIKLELNSIRQILAKSTLVPKRQSVTWQVREIARRLKKSGVPVPVIASQLHVSAPFVYQLQPDVNYGVKAHKVLNEGDQDAWIDAKLREYIQVSGVKVYEKGVFNESLTCG